MQETSQRILLCVLCALIERNERARECLCVLRGRQSDVLRYTEPYGKVDPVGRKRVAEIHAIAVGTGMPATTADDAQLAGIGALRILLGRTGLVVRIVSIGHPFHHIAAHVEQIESVGRELPDRQKSGSFRMRVVGLCRIDIVSEWIRHAFKPPAYCVFPFGFGR